MNNMPIYVTRKYGSNEEQGQLSMGVHQALLVLIIVWVNLVLWGIVGIIKGVEVLI